VGELWVLRPTNGEGTDQHAASVQNTEIQRDDMIWEIQRLDWSSLRASGDAAGVPAALLALQQATDEREALRAYWRIDNVVVVQGRLYEAALPTVNALLIGLTGCTTVARPHLLELLVQLASGETAPSEVMLGNLQLAERCRAALPAGLSVFLALLEERRPTEQAHLFDLLGLCAEVCPSARAQVVDHLTRALATEEGATSDNVTLGQNWLSALRSGP